MSENWQERAERAEREALSYYAWTQRLTSERGEFLIRAERAEAERDQARAHLAKVREVLADSDSSPEVSCGGMGVFATGCYVRDLALKIRATLGPVGATEVWREESADEIQESADTNAAIRRWSEEFRREILVEPLSSGRHCHRVRLILRGRRATRTYQAACEEGGRRTGRIAMGMEPLAEDCHWLGDRTSSQTLAREQADGHAIYTHTTGGKCADHAGCWACRVIRGTTPRQMRGPDVKS